jgi:hypothetical protein
MENLNEQELDISYAQGLLEAWVGYQTSGVREQLADNLKVLIDGIEFYKKKYENNQGDYILLRDRYDQLTGLCSTYLGMIQELRTQNENLLIEQRKSDNENRME